MSAGQGVAVDEVLGDGRQPDVAVLRLQIDVSIEVADVDAAYIGGQAAGFRIVRGLRDEAWAILRPFVYPGLGSSDGAAG